MVDNVNVATDIELIVIRYLDRHKIAYQFQTSLSGGYFELGGAVVDFLVEPNLAWRVFGEYWHQEISTSGRDIVQRELLESMGYTVVDLWGSDIKNRLEETLTKALRGEEMLR